MQEILSAHLLTGRSSGSLNRLGYSFLYEHLYDVAIFVFKENVKMFPESANAYDSLGEAYMRKGEKDLAKENFRKSLTLDPNNTNAKEMLIELSK